MSIASMLVALSADAADKPCQYPASFVDSVEDVDAFYDALDAEVAPALAGRVLIRNEISVQLTPLGRFGVDNYVQLNPDTNGPFFQSRYSDFITNLNTISFL